MNGKKAKAIRKVVNENTPYKANDAFYKDEVVKVVEVATGALNPDGTQVFLSQQRITTSLEPVGRKVYQTLKKGYKQGDKAVLELL